MYTSFQSASQRFQTMLNGVLVALAPLLQASSRPQGAPEGGAVTMSQRATSKRAMRQ